MQSKTNLALIAVLSCYTETETTTLLLSLPKTHRRGGRNSCRYAVTFSVTSDLLRGFLLQLLRRLVVFFAVNSIL